MSKRDGFDIAVGGVKVGSFQTNLQDDGTREMYAFGNGMKLHFGGQVVEGEAPIGCHRTRRARDAASFAAPLKDPFADRLAGVRSWIGP